MDYNEKPEEFYGLMREKKEEINSLDISDSEKNNLYKLVDETVQRFEDDKPNSISEKIPKLNKSLDKLGDGLGEVVNAHQRIKKELSNLGNTVFKVKLKKAFDSQNPKNN